MVDADDGRAATDGGDQVRGRMARPDVDVVGDGLGHLEGHLLRAPVLAHDDAYGQVDVVLDGGRVEVVTADTRERVAEVARRLGYVASPEASRLATGATRSVALVVPHLDRWYFGEIVGGLHRRVQGLARSLG